MTEYEAQEGNSDVSGDNRAKMRSHNHNGGATHEGWRRRSNYGSR